jgi:integrase
MVGFPLLAQPSPISNVGRRGFPSLRRHATGVYFWREDGRNVYQGKDAAAAQRAWLERFGSRLSAQPSAAAPQLTQGTGLLPQAAPLAVSPALPLRTVRDVAEKLESILDAQCTPERARVYRYELAPFVSKFGSRPLAALSAEDLLTYRASLVKRYKPWTVNGRLALIRRLLNLSDELGWVERPFKLRVLKSVPIGETKPKAWTPEQVNARLRKVAETNPNLARMLRLQWLCCLRPFSVPEVVFGRGEWEGRGVFVLSRSKTEKQTGERQRVCFSEAALEELKRIEPEYGEGRLYRQACQRAGGFAPHPIRHSACTALANADVPDELIECAMGHSLGKVKRVYRPQKFQRTREALGVLAELVPAL